MGEKKVMNEIEFSALMVSRVCHDLVGPLGAVVNGLEVLEDERDAAMRDDAIKLVTSSANQALARIQFMRIAFGAAGSAGAELDLGEIGRLIDGPAGRRQGQAGMEGAPCLLGQGLGQAADERHAAGRRQPAARRRGHGGGGRRRGHAQFPDRRRRARWPGSPKMSSAPCGAKQPAGPVDARGIQPQLTYRLARSVNAGLTVTAAKARSK